MAEATQIRNFTGGKREFTSHLNDLVGQSNSLSREFHERERAPIDNPAINAAIIKITAAETGIGYYKATVLAYAVLGVDPSQNLTAAQLGGTDGESVLAMLPSELGATAHSMTIPAGGLYRWAHLTALGSKDGRRVVSILSGAPGIIDVRYNYTTDALEVSFDGTTWISKVTFITCTTDTSKPFFNF